MKTVRSGLQLAVMIAVAVPVHATGDWQEIRRERDITVWKRDVAGSNTVEFRGRGIVRAPIIQVAAVLRNSGREREWMESCAEARVVEWRSPTHAVIYNRTASPVFFVSDRDIVVEARTRVLAAERALSIDFGAVENSRAPEVAGVVRMKQVKGHWKLTMIDAETTEVEYQIAANPSGAIPAWIANWATEKIPFNTIDKLRGQVVKSGYENDVMILERAIDWSVFERDAAKERRAGL